MREVVIAGYARSPFQPAHKGELVRVRPDELAAQVIAGLIERSPIEPGAIEDLIVGCAFPEGEQGLNVARLIGFLARLPESVAATTVNRFCGSSMQAVHMAAGAVAMGAGDAFVCAGVESMSRVPVMGFNPMPHPGLARDYPQAYVAMGETAENLARRHGIARAAQEEFAVRSHAKAAAAHAAGHLAAELVPIRIGDHGCAHDGCIRAGTTAPKL
ncbi:MAG: acetyl-CoA C-acyltransferase, partial [Geminicoccaceae bacterium]